MAPTYKGDESCDFEAPVNEKTGKAAGPISRAWALQREGSENEKCKKL
jgi:hypothetical protein